MGAASFMSQYRVFADRYPLIYERMPDVGAIPVTVQSGSTIYLPENLGYIDSNCGSILGCTELDKLENLLDHLEVFEDSTAPIFWHPWRDRAELETIVHSVGIVWVPST